MKYLLPISLSFSLFGLSACSTFQTKKPELATVTSPTSTIKTAPIQEYKLGQKPTPPPVVDPEMLKIPVDMNPLVGQWVKYFQGRGRHHMERYLGRMTRYGDLMKQILRENGMPDDLLYIALIESGFSSRAVSHASAVGYWQFIKPTGRRYDLEVSTLVDERRDPVLSTQAAAAYFKDLYGMFNSWYLSMAGYNAGENRIQRAVNKHKTRDFWELAARKRALPKETLHYVPKYIAARLIANDPVKYGFTDIEYEAPLEFESIQVSHPVDLRKFADTMGFDYDEFKLLNPKFKGSIAPLDRQSNLYLRIPIGSKEKALASVGQCQIDASQVAHIGNEEVKTYRVRRGDTIQSIARKHFISVELIRNLNDLSPTQRLRVGKRLDVPRSRSTVWNIKKENQTTVARSTATPEIAEAPAIETQAQDGEVETVRPKYHLVQKGDTLTGIAEEYEVTIAELIKLNKLKRKSLLHVGLRLKLPKVEALPTAVAEKEADRRNSSIKRSPTRVSTSKRKSTVTIKTHIVKRGENLQLIASKYRITVARIIAKNKLKNPSYLLAGQRINIPFYD